MYDAKHGIGRVGGPKLRAGLRDFIGVGGKYKTMKNKDNREFSEWCKSTAGINETEEEGVSVVF